MAGTTLNWRTARIRASLVGAGRDDPGRSRQPRLALRVYAQRGGGNRIPGVPARQQRGGLCAHRRRPPRDGPAHRRCSWPERCGCRARTEPPPPCPRRSRRDRRCGRRWSARQQPYPPGRRCRTARTATGSRRSRRAAAAGAARRRVRNRPVAPDRQRPPCRSGSAVRRGRCRVRRSRSGCRECDGADGRSPG